MTPLRLLVVASLLGWQDVGQRLRRLGRRWDEGAAARLAWWQGREP